MSQVTDVSLIHVLQNTSAFDPQSGRTRVKAWHCNQNGTSFHEKQFWTSKIYFATRSQRNETGIHWTKSFERFV